MRKIAFIIILTLLAAVLRFASFTNNPPSLNIDEVAFGYNAYSILKTGRDEYDVFLPLSFKSVGDYKNPVPTYLMVPSIAIFGLNEVGVRFPNALIGVLTVPFLYLLVRKLLGERIALVATVLFAISPWHIYYTRYSYESSMAASFLIVGTWAFLEWLDGKISWLILSAVFFSLSIYTYYSERLFLPLFLLALVVIYFKKLKQKGGQSWVWVVLIGLMSLPMFIFSVFGPGGARASMTCICNDINFQRNITVINQFLFKPVVDLSFLSADKILLFFFWVKKYLAYFQPAYLFYGSLRMVIQDEFSLGVAYFFEIPLIIFGIFTLVRNKFENKNLILAWILLGIFPASITLNDQHSGRTLIILPMLVLVSALGAIGLWDILTEVKSSYLRRFIYGLFSLVILWNLAESFLLFAVHFPKERGEAFMEGTKEAVEYALSNESQYKQIVFDPVRGVAGPYVVSVPYMYTLFYSKYDPASYQAQNDPSGKAAFGFDKFKFRRIDWPNDQKQKGILFIGSPWSLPLQDLKKSKVLKRIYLSNGALAFLIVTP